RSAGTALSAATRAKLGAARVDATVHVGPIRRREWPFRGAGAMLVPPPPVSMDSTADVTVHATGSLLGPDVTVEGEFATANLPVIGLLEPFAGHLLVELQPATA